MTTTPRRFTATKSRSLSGEGVRRLLASYSGPDAAVVPDFKMQPGMLYTQVRAISARINQNYDAWPSTELRKSYKTFLGKPVFVNHANFDPEKARGRVVAARYIESGDDRYVEVIQEVDGQRFPKLAKEIHEGGLDSVSMGVEAGFTKCSVCDNRATDMSDMCDHVKYHKGEYLPHKKTGKKTLVYENCLVTGTLVTMGDGTTRPIESIRAGDFVLDHLGTPRTVLQTMNRQVNEDTLRIHRQNTQTQAPQMTGNHPVLAIRGSAFGKDTFTRQGRLDRGLRPEFIEARELQVGDWVCETHPATDSSLVKILTADYTRQTRQHETCFTPVHILPDTLELTEDLGRFIGLFLAEGSVNKALTQADFAFHRDETHLADFVDQIARQVLGLTSITHGERNGGRTVTIFSSPLSQMLSHFGVGASHKGLPDEFMSAPIDFLRGVVTGHEQGDGLHGAEFVQRHGHKHFTTSPRLAEQIYTIHVMLGNTPYHSTRQTRSDYAYPGKSPATWLPMHTVGFGNEGQKKVGRLSFGPWTFVRIKDLEVLPYSGPVYNLEVADTHTYVAEGVAVHNCFKLGFFELSYVFDPADETAVVSRVVVANNRQGYIPTREELALADAKEKARLEKKRTKKRPVRKFIRDLTDPQKVLDGLENDRKMRDYKQKYRLYPELRAASIVNDYDWADLGRRARAQGAPIQASRHPEIAAILANLDGEQAHHIQSQYAQGWKRAANRRHAVEDEAPKRRLDESSSMNELGTTHMGDLPEAPTSYNVTPGAPSGGGGSSGMMGGGGSFGGSSATPGGGAPSQSLTEALGRAGIDPAMYPLISGFSATEGNNPSGAPTLGFTDSQAGTSLDSHAQALSQQLHDRQSVAGDFPHSGTPAEQASWMATVVGQNGVSSDWQGNAQPARSTYINNIVNNMPTGKIGYRYADDMTSMPQAMPSPEPPKKRMDDSSTMNELGNMQMGDLPYAPTSYNVTPGAPSGGSSGGGSGGGGGGGVSNATGGSAGAPGPDGLLDNNRALYNELEQQFPGADIGKYRVDSYHEHDHGALDFMHPTDPTKVEQDAFNAGSPYVLWHQQQINAPWYNGGGTTPMEDRHDPTQNHYDHMHLAPPGFNGAQMPAGFHMGERRYAWGEIEAPEDIDTLREQSEDDGQDNFHHYVESPEELKTPDFDQAKRLDRAQEQEGLDGDRRVEDIEEVGAPAQGGKMAPSSRQARRFADAYLRYAEAEEELALLNQAQGDLSFAESQLQGGDPPHDDDGYDEDEDPHGDHYEDDDEDGGDEDWDHDGSGEGYDDDEDQPDGDHDEDDGHPEDEEADEEQGGLPPQLAYTRPVRNASSQRNVRRTQKGRPMGINLSERGRFASRGRRHFTADDNGYTDGGPYGRNDLGEQEEVHISDQFGGDGVPAAEAVATPEAGDSISNTENTLVARVQRGTEQLRRDASALAYLRQRKAAMYRTADDNIIDPTTVNPDLSGTDAQSLKGDDFDNVALDNVATQPKDASIHAFAAFDDWLARSTGRTARQHGNANFIRREAARYIRATGVPLGNLFPTLEKVLVEARKAETTKEATMKRFADEKLEVAAPGDRIDVEAPVKNVTDAEAQASQYALSDYAGNASDNLASPDLSTDSQIWAPGEGTKTSNRMADAVAAVRCAEAYIKAGLAPTGEKWQLIARFQTMRHATVVDRTRLLEQVADNNAASARQRSAAVSRGTRGIPQGLGSGQRTAQTYRAADNDPSNDSLLFFK